jgi:hypothetical protein
MQAQAAKQHHRASSYSLQVPFKQPHVADHILLSIVWYFAAAWWQGPDWSSSQGDMLHFPYAM